MNGPLDNNLSGKVNGIGPSVIRQSEQPVFYTSSVVFRYLVVKIEPMVNDLVIIKVRVFNPRPLIKSKYISPKLDPLGLSTMLLIKSAVPCDSSKQFILTSIPIVYVSYLNVNKSHLTLM